MDFARNLEVLARRYLAERYKTYRRCLRTGRLMDSISAEDKIKFGSRGIRYDYILRATEKYAKFVEYGTGERRPHFRYNKFGLNINLSPSTGWSYRKPVYVYVRCPKTPENRRRLYYNRGQEAKLFLTEAWAHTHEYHLDSLIEELLKLHTKSVKHARYKK